MLTWNPGDCIGQQRVDEAISAGPRTPETMKLVLTVSTWNFKHLADQYASPLRALERIQSLGFGAELWLNWQARPDWADREHWEQLRGLLRHRRWLSLHTRNQRERMLEELELLAYLGGRVLVAHPCVLSQVAYRQERPARHPDLGFIRELAAAAREYGVLLAVENIFGREFLDLTLRGVESYDEAGGLGICIDLGHAELRRGEPGQGPVELIRDFGQAVVHLHVHDVADGRDHLPLGAGQMDYAAIAEALAEVDFQGTAALELQAADPVAAAEAGWALLRRQFGPALVRPAEV